MKKLGTTIIVILVVLFALSLAKDMIIKTGVEKGAAVVTGLRLDIDSLRVGIIKTLVGLKGLRLHNPERYKDDIMLDVPEVYVDYNLPDILKGKIHLNEVRLNMNEFVVIKNEKGELNLDSLKVVQAEKKGEKPAEAEEKAGGKAPEIQIDVLELAIGKVAYKDYSGGGAPSVKEFNINLNERYENITDPYPLVSLIVVKALMNTSIANLTGFDLGGLQGTVSGTLASAQEMVGEAAAQAQERIAQTQRQAQEAMKQGQEALKQSQQQAQEAGDKLKKATEGLKDIKLPFGN